MPRYDFKCERCGMTVDLDRHVDQRNVRADCANCGGLRTMYRLALSQAPGFILKGDGWPGQDIKRKKR